MTSATEDNALRPLPLADDASTGFWAAANEGRLDIQRCASCRRWNHAPSLACPGCGSFDMAYEAVSGKATLHAWTVIKEAPAPGFRNMLPLIVGVVELAEQPHLVLGANILEASIEDLHIGMPLEVMFEQLGEGIAVPQFRPAGA
jgi:uncharacterized protein